MNLRGYQAAPASFLQASTSLSCYLLKCYHQRAAA